MVAAGALPVRVAVWPSALVSGGSKLPSIRWMSFMARPRFSAGTSSRNVYQRLQQLCFADLIGHHQALPHRAVGRLPEIAALGVLQVGPARDEGNLHIRQRGPGQHAPGAVFSSRWVSTSRCQFLSSTSSRQSVANCIPLPGGQRFQHEVHLGIVAQGLVVAHALHRPR